MHCIVLKRCQIFNNTVHGEIIVTAKLMPNLSVIAKFE